ncbi:hypothetical protein LPJ66_005556 [Kickxella alabastrina]|uniref:Uncharacterized protein n=1 Tax=Kickxella alabastrina TaxID=61397 RepID=A0ACC1IGH2_9FUNG|nr:hypothetical protein LPJ66_005556 [Kickxella alabastrina]
MLAACAYAQGPAFDVSALQLGVAADPGVAALAAIGDPTPNAVVADLPPPAQASSLDPASIVANVLASANATAIVASVDAVNGVGLVNESVANALQPVSSANAPEFANVNEINSFVQSLQDTIFENAPLGSLGTEFSIVEANEWSTELHTQWSNHKESGASIISDADYDDENSWELGIDSDDAELYSGKWSSSKMKSSKESSWDSDDEFNSVSARKSTSGSAGILNMNILMHAVGIVGGALIIF